MFFYALWWSFCVELDALRTMSHRPQRVNALRTAGLCRQNGPMGQKKKKEHVASVKMVFYGEAMAKMYKG
jgi:hypothetical protein